MPSLETLIGAAAAFCTTVSYVPQLRKCWETGETGDLSLKGTLDDPFEDESFANASYFAEALMHLMIRANLKQDCKALWSDYTRLNHRWFEVSEPWQFCTVHSEHGLNVNKVVPSAGQWTSLQEQASKCENETPKVPARLRADPVLLLLFVVVVPQRATPDVVRFLASDFSDVWFLPQPRPTR
jgi:hypothetical protein